MHGNKCRPNNLRYNNGICPQKLCQHTENVRQNCRYSVRDTNLCPLEYEFSKDNKNEVPEKYTV